MHKLVPDVTSTFNTKIEVVETCEESYRDVIYRRSAATSGGFDVDGARDARGGHGARDACNDGDSNREGAHATPPPLIHEKARYLGPTQTHWKNHQLGSQLLIADETQARSRENGKN
ncbi:hypothetical protein EVAR_11092_1 [Eumeta japonica]|uniref:Uncharacterized protein n=1 Tax=Eumeta variegata TaxID=151549 RepID=A0A4C1U434_EUMVA|nr:hypothetical protein EVAR_11092_1 [Eumeta japonica]